MYFNVYIYEWAWPTSWLINSVELRTYTQVHKYVSISCFLLRQRPVLRGSILCCNRRLQRLKITTGWLRSNASKSKNCNSFRFSFSGCCGWAKHSCGTVKTRGEWREVLKREVALLRVHWILIIEFTVSVCCIITLHYWNTG